MWNSVSLGHCLPNPQYNPNYKQAVGFFATVWADSGKEPGHVVEECLGSSSCRREADRPAWEYMYLGDWGL